MTVDFPPSRVSAIVDLLVSEIQRLTVSSEFSLKGDWCCVGWDEVK